MPVTGFSRFFARIAVPFSSLAMISIFSMKPSRASFILTAKQKKRLAKSLNIAAPTANTSCRENLTKSDSARWPNASKMRSNAFRPLLTQCVGRPQSALVSQRTSITVLNEFVRTKSKGQRRVEQSNFVSLHLRVAEERSSRQPVSGRVTDRTMSSPMSPSTLAEANDYW